MKFKTIALAAAAIASLLTLGACGENEIYLGPGESEGDTHPVAGDMIETMLRGTVTDTDGNPIQGVTVTSGTAVTTTDVAGGFQFTESNIVDYRLVARFEKEGYFSVTRSFEWEGLENSECDVVLVSKSDSRIAASSTFNSSTSSRLSVHNFSVELPGGAYVNKITGEPYSGTVRAEMVYLNPDSEDFPDMMPGGDMTGVRTDGDRSMLISYGMTGVNLTDASGNPLQLDGVHEATLKFSVPEGLRDRTPATIPLWSFNETSGLWEEEGVAELRNGVYVGTVRHFSWVNLDDPEQEARIEGYVFNSDNVPVRGLAVTVNQRTVRTNSNGFYECRVPSDVRFEVKVNSKAYGRYKSVVSISVDPLEAGETRKLNAIFLPRLNTVYGTIVNLDGGSNVCSIWLSYGTRQTATVKSAANGEFYLYAPEGYTGPATLHVLTVENEEQTFLVDLGKGDCPLGNIYIKTTVGSGGIINVQLENGSVSNLPIPSMDDYSGGVIITPSGLMVQDENERFVMQIPGYTADKENYTGATMRAVNGEEIVQSIGTLGTSVRRKGSTYVFNMSGTGQYYSANTGVLNATVSATNVGLPLLMKTYTMVNVSDPVKQCGFPSFTPWLRTMSAAAVMVIEESPLVGTGGTILYNGTEEDYNTLRGMVPRTFSVLADDSENLGGTIYKEYAAQQGNNVIMIDYDSSMSDVDINDPEAAYEGDARVVVTAFTNVSDEYWDMMTRDGTRKLNIAKLRNLVRRHR